MKGEYAAFLYHENNVDICDIIKSRSKILDGMKINIKSHRNAFGIRTGCDVSVDWSKK